EDGVRARERRGGGRARAVRQIERAVVREEEKPDREEEDELHEDDDARDVKRGAGTARAVGAEVALHEVLIGAVRRHRQERASDEACPERREGAVPREREIEEAELAEAGGRLERGGEAAR